MRIQIHKIKKSYRGKPVLLGADLEAESGSCVGILGCNGSGKSTLLSILAGVLERDEGEFLLDGSDLFRSPQRRAAAVGYVPQGTPLMEELTARDNLLLWYDRKTMETELQTGVLSLLGIGEFLHMPVRKLSGGMKKRLSIGCAMAGRPPILLLDEPTAALDLIARERIGTYLQEFKRSGGIVLLATHDAMELALCDRWYILKNGVLEPFSYDGDLSELVKRL